MKASFQLSRNSDGFFVAEIPFEGKISRHQTKTKDRAAAEKIARRRVKRLPIEKRAHEKFRAKQRKQRAAPATRPPAAPPAIDATATAAKLRALPVSAGAGDVEPKAEDPPPQTPAAPEKPAPASAGEAPPAPVVPELPPEKPVDEPITPEIGDDRQPDDGDAESQEFFADVVANAIVVGTVKLCHDAADKQGKVANEPSPKGLEWYTEGLQYRLRKLMGDASMGPNAKLFVGAGAVVLSMLWGCADKPGAAPRAPRESAQQQQQQPTTPAPSSPTQQRPPDRHPGADQGGQPFDELALVKLQPHRNGAESASGTFR